MCLEGFRSSIRVACIFELDNERNTFLNALISFTLLQGHRVMQSKHVRAIKVLLDLAGEKRRDVKKRKTNHFPFCSDQDGNLLREGWMQVLKCVSLLDQLRMTRMEAAHTQGKEAGPNQGGRNAAGMKTKKRRKKKLIEREGLTYFFSPANEDSQAAIQSENWALISAEVSSDQIDQMFPRSAQLDSGAIVHFVKCLVAISHMEIQQVFLSLLSVLLFLTFDCRLLPPCILCPSWWKLRRTTWRACVSSGPPSGE